MPVTTVDERVLESKRVTTWLRDAILDGVLAPGGRLVERDLAGGLGVSRIPVRDALKALEAEGLVELRPRTWGVVREFTETDLADLDEVREVVEPLAFRLAAQRRRRDGLIRLRRALDDERAGARADEPAVSRRGAADFHEIVTDLAENPLLSLLMQSIGNRLRWALSQHDDFAHIIDEHVALYEAIRDLDADRAAALARAHIHSSRSRRTAHARTQSAGARG